MTKSALKSLGRRLKHNDPPADEDLEKLEEVLLSYDLTLARVTDVLRDLGYQPTSRLKTTGTLIEKLRREESMPLPSVQDIAGARIVLSNGRKVQDRAAFRIQEKFRSIGECSDWIDRRERPSSGYRALHLTVTLDGITVEIQIRTEMQDLWAQCFERLADTWGRAIRYGGDPIEPDAPTDPALQLRGISAAATRRQTCDALRGPLSDFIDELESVQADIERSLETEAVAEAHQHLENLKHRRDSVEASLREDLKTWRHVVEEIR